MGLKADSQNSKRRQVSSRGEIYVWAGMALAFAGVLVFHVAPSVKFAPVAALLPSYQLELAKAGFADGGNQITPAVGRAAQLAGSGAPLEAVPFYYRAIEQEMAGRGDDVLPLLDEALKRDPRHYYARLWRARIYYRTQRIPEAVDEVLKVMPLNRAGARDYVEAIVDVARDPRNRSLVLELVAKQPEWGPAFIQRVNAEIDDESFALALASLSDASLKQHIRSLMDKGEYERAFLIWQSALTEEQMLAFSWPVDPRFAIDGGDIPFGWRTERQSTSRDPDGLYVFYNGRGKKGLVSQAMLLGPAHRYRISVLVSGEMRDRGGWFHWTMTCTETQQVVGDLAIRSIDPGGRPVTFEATIPEDGCVSQALSLGAEPGEYTFAARLVIREVRIDPLGAVDDAPLAAGTTGASP